MTNNHTFDFKGCNIWVYKVWSSWKFPWNVRACMDTFSQEFFRALQCHTHRAILSRRVRVITKVFMEWVECSLIKALVAVKSEGSFFPFLRFYLFSFRERGREGEREGEKHQCVVASPMPPTGDLARNPGMCPDWESNQRPFGSQAGTQSTVVFVMS